jgi:hypothetical protein
MRRLRECHCARCMGDGPPDSYWAEVPEDEEPEDDRTEEREDDDTDE